MRIEYLSNSGEGRATEEDRDKHSVRDERCTVYRRNR